MLAQGRGDSLYERLNEFSEFGKQEWVERGHNEAEFETQGPQIVILLDNASYHKRADILTRIKHELKTVILEFISAYSPDYNLIELVWHSCQE